MPCVPDAFGCPHSKEFGEVVAMAAEGTADELAANFAEHAASGFTGCEQVGKISADRIPCGDAFIPRPQGSEGVAIGQFTRLAR